MTRISIPWKAARSDRSVQEFLRWNVARNIVIKKSEADEWSCFLETQDTVDDARTGDGIPKKVIIDTGLIYRYMRKGEQGVIEGPGLRELVSHGRSAYRNVAQAAENALLPDLFEKLVRVSVVEVSMGPLQSILTDLATLKHVETTKGGRAYRSRSNLSAYLELLSDLEYAKREGSILVPGAAFERALKIRPDEDSAVHWMMGDILRQRGTYMREVLHWSMMVPYLRWTNAYYWRALEADRLPLMNQAALEASYSNIYGRPTHGHPTTQVMRLARAEVFHKIAGNQYEGDREIFEPYAQRASEQPAIATALQLATA